MFVVPGIDGILSEDGPLEPITQELLLGVAILMSTPCAMVWVAWNWPKINEPKEV